MTHSEKKRKSRKYTKIKGLSCIFSTLETHCLEIRSEKRKKICFGDQGKINQR